MATPAPYLLSKIADPLFAIFIGTSAAFVRIRREEIEKRGPEKTGVVDILNTGRERVTTDLGLWWNGASGEKGKG